MDVDPRPAIRLPLGVRDFLPRAAARRRALAETLLGTFESWGYARIITPIFECADVIERGLGDSSRDAAIRFVEPGTGEVVALRPDITPQVARIAATRMSDIDGPLRFCYQGAVTRLGAGAKTQREILQAGVELIGADSPGGDAEVIAVAGNALAAMNLPRHIRLDVGHVGLARHALERVEDRDRRLALAELLARKDRSGVARAARGLPAGHRQLLTALPTLWGAPQAVLHRASALSLPAEVRRSLKLLAVVLKSCRDVVEADLHSAITVDLGEIRGVGRYYTGIRFAGYADGVGDAVLRGGRYDTLVARYGRDARATGFAVDIEAIAEAQRRGGIDPPGPAEAVLVVTPKARRREGTRLAAALRVRGYRAAVDLGRWRSRNTLVKYAREVGFTAILQLTGRGPRIVDTRGFWETDRTVSEAAISRALSGDARTLIRALQSRRRKRRQ